MHLGLMYRVPQAARAMHTAQYMAAQYLSADLIVSHWRALRPGENPDE